MAAEKQFTVLKSVPAVVETQLQQQQQHDAAAASSQQYASRDLHIPANLAASANRNSASALASLTSVVYSPSEFLYAANQSAFDAASSSTGQEQQQQQQQQHLLLQQQQHQQAGLQPHAVLMAGLEEELEEGEVRGHALELSCFFHFLICKSFSRLLKARLSLHLTLMNMTKAMVA